MIVCPVFECGTGFDDQDAERAHWAEKHANEKNTHRPEPRKSRRPRAPRSRARRSTRS
jgi:hypothetical protein